MGNRIYTNYKCQTKDMYGCVEKLLKWINEATKAVQDARRRGIEGMDEWVYLSRKVSKWSFTIDEVEYDLEDALDALWNKACDNLEVVQNRAMFVDNESQAIERERMLNEAISAYNERNLDGVKDALRGFLKAE